MTDIPDAAVEAAVGEFYARPAHNMAAAYHESMREALTAALPHLLPAMIQAARAEALEEAARELENYTNEFSDRGDDPVGYVRSLPDAIRALMDAAPYADGGEP
jgi:hypothetical protein